ncbi:MAG: S1/P1 nuclease [Bacteroidota bacterium]|nr:S1/P1 nuclease [Bacteroidota bacterium]
MKTIKQLTVVAFLFSLPFYSFAWGVLGHRIVGQVAERYLTTKAKNEIQKILGSESLAMASNWGDFIKSDSTYKYISPWHYINLDEGLTDAQLQLFLKKDTTTDLYTKLNFLVKELKIKTLPLDKKRMYLRLLIHFVGDAHQPFHAGRRDDLGGNKIKVTWFGAPTNLHAVWDESLINFQQLSYTEYAQAINHPTQKQVKDWQKGTIGQWLIESYQISENLYPEITEANQKLGYEYNFKHIETLNERLLKGGVRLAGLLNNIFG